MLMPPSFSTLNEYRKHLNDEEFWRPYVIEVLKRHDLEGRDFDLISGVGGTYPTFLYGDVVVKLFGFFEAWKESYSIESSAQTLVSGVDQLLVPKLINCGNLFSDQWPYLVLSKVPGIPWFDSNLSSEEMKTVACDLGKQIEAIHKLSPTEDNSTPDLKNLDVVSGARKSILPPHLVEQVETFLAKQEFSNGVFVHSDLTARHVFVDEGRLTGIIDWGDAATFDKHYELTKLHLDMFRCDKDLLSVFLRASNWPVESDFSKRSLAMALYRQAIGLTQHFTFDAFHLVAKLFPLEEIATLDDLADELFSV